MTREIIIGGEMVRAGPLIFDSFSHHMIYKYGIWFSFNHNRMIYMVNNNYKFVNFDSSRIDEILLFSKVEEAFEFIDTKLISILTMQTACE